jgi:uncharacterized membrane protein YdjX (TVP38/TMEM64 family)
LCCAKRLIEPKFGAIIFLRYRRLLGVIASLLLLWGVFYITGWRNHLNLRYLQDTLAAHPQTGLLIFMLLFTMGNLVQIPGWIFLAAAVLTLG